MAVLAIHLRNGDTIHIGTDPQQTRAAYDALLSAKTEFVELQAYFGNLPRLAIRCADVVVLILDPNDNSTTFASSAQVRTAQYYAYAQQRAQSDQANTEPVDVKV